MNSTSPPNAVIVLGNLMDASGRLNTETRARVETAVHEMRGRNAPMLVTCGWAYRDDSTRCIADAMRDHAIQMGIPAEAVHAERAPRDTVGDAVFTLRNLALPRRWRRVVVVTSQYHTARTRSIFAFIYGPDIEIEVVSAPSADTPELQASEARSLEVFRSTFRDVDAGDAAAILTRLKQAHPFYNGAVYSFDNAGEAITDGRLTLAPTAPGTVLFLGYGPDETCLIEALRDRGWTITHTRDRVTDLSGYDAVVSFGYRHILREPVLNSARRPPLNLHISYLPSGRGAHPLFWASMNDTQIGVTIHEIDPGIDTGPVCVQARVAISPDEDTFNIAYRRLIGAVEQLFINNMDDLLAGRYVARTQVGEGVAHRTADLPAGFSWDDVISVALQRLKTAI